MHARHRWTLRENAPLHGVSAILLLAVAALALANNRSQNPTADPASDAIPASEVAALPASAEDDSTILSILDPDDARSRNAAVPIVEGALSLAPPFVFRGNGTDRTRARDCLAIAAMAEAGGGDADQRAVMQVILNRTRHPAFANTVCGAVFEGSQRPTGCQFTFTCDGSLRRTYSQASWRTARERAEEALGGYVHAAVGSATHYHADYVYPYWSASLDKVAIVGPHLFFRWRGDWGTGRALTARYAGGEPDPLALSEAAQAVDRPADLLPRLARQGTAVRTITTMQTINAEGAIEPVSEAAAAASADSPGPGAHFVLVSRGDSPAALIERARALCPGDRYCQVYGWDDPAAIPAALPLTREARRALRFSFVPSRSGNPEMAYVDCQLFAAAGGAQCLPRAQPIARR